MDVGANDPIQWSVTKALYDKGWRGINIEPLEDKYKALCENRAEDINLNMGISDTPGELKFLKANDLSTFDVDTQNELTNNSHKGDISVVKVDTLENIFESLKNKIILDKVFFCKIDVEGFERNVIEGIDFKKMRPWVFCVENRKIELWESLLTGNGYSFVLADTINRWYVADEKSYISNKLLPSAELIKIYDVYQVIKYDELELLKTNSLKAQSIYAKLKKLIKKISWVLKERGFIELCKITVSHISDWLNEAFLGRR